MISRVLLCSCARWHGWMGPLGALYSYSSCCSFLLLLRLLLLLQAAAQGGAPAAAPAGFGHSLIK